MASLLPTKTHFHIVVTDSGWLLKAQEFTVPGNQSHLDIGGLITGIGYEVRLTGVSESGLLSRPLTAVAVTGTTQCTVSPPVLLQSPVNMHVIISKIIHLSVQFHFLISETDFQ
uniref:Fibronectin type-III domain-containing protein n=1 Tax=Haplochromis burtoni TaxID=8153 RepID=A0A3Q2VCL4_HAPBU